MDQSAPHLCSDEALATRIRRYYSGLARLHHQEIEAAVAQGCATLTGTTDIWLARQRVTQMALEAGARGCATC